MSHFQCDEETEVLENSFEGLLSFFPPLQISYQTRLIEALNEWKASASPWKEMALGTKQASIQLCNSWLSVWLLLKFNLLKNGAIKFSHNNPLRAHRRMDESQSKVFRKPVPVSCVPIATNATARETRTTYIQIHCILELIRRGLGYATRKSYVQECQKRS